MATNAATTKPSRKLQPSVPRNVRGGAEINGLSDRMSGPRTVWKGYLSLARISCAVRLQPAVVRMDRLGLQPLNRTTLNRAQLRPYDPQTGREIGRDALLKGYEFEPGRFVVVEDRELAELRVESMRNIVLDRFLDASTVDAAYLDTPYYLLPDAPASAGSYALIRAAMLRTGRAAIGHIVLGGREYAALVQPRGRGLVLTTMRAAAELRSEETAFAGLAEDEPDPQLVEMASLVVGQLNGTFDPRRDFRERFQEALFQLVQAKLRGEKPVFPPAAPAIRVTALGEAVASSLRAGEPAERAVSSRYSTALRQ